MTSITERRRRYLKYHKPFLILFTGLSGAGKTTIGTLVENRLISHGYHTYMIDGDAIRSGLNSDIGFSKDSRIENSRRAAEVSAMMHEAGLVTIASFIFAYRDQREVFKRIYTGKIIDVFLDPGIDVCIKRDTKGFYKSKKIKDFTGIDSPFEIPEDYDLRIDTGKISKDDAIEMIIKKIKDEGLWKK